MLQQLYSHLSLIKSDYHTYFASQVHLIWLSYIFWFSSKFLKENIRQNRDYENAFLYNVGAWKSDIMLCIMENFLCELHCVCVRKRAEGLSGFISSFINHNVLLPSHTLLSVSLLLRSRSLGYITTWRGAKSAETLLTSAKSLLPHVQKDAELFSWPEIKVHCVLVHCCGCTKPALLSCPSEMCTSHRMS